MTLTEQGKSLLFYIEEAYNNLMVGERILTEDESFSNGRLSIGVPSHVGRFFIFDKIEDFHRKYPNIDISIVSRSTNELMQLLENHDIDFAIDTSPIGGNYSNLSILPLKEVSHCFFVKSNTSIEGINHITSVKQLKNFPMILPVSRSYHRKCINNLMIELDSEFTNVLSIETSEMILTAVQKDIGIGYVLRDLIEEEIKKGYFKEIMVEEELPKVEINLIYIDKYLTKVPQKYIKDFLGVSF